MYDLRSGCVGVEVEDLTEFGGGLVVVGEDAFYFGPFARCGERSTQLSR